MFERLRRRVGAFTNRLRSVVGTSSGGSPRVHAHRDDDVVVFIVGMRINAFWKLHRWIPVFVVAPRMARELRQDPDSGLLGSWTWVSPPRTIGFVQYWDSFESLRSYARDSEYLHLDAWEDYNQNRADGSVGIFHETYLVENYETVYNNTPSLGLADATGSDVISASDQLADAAGRLEHDGDEVDPTPAND